MSVLSKLAEIIIGVIAEYLYGPLSRNDGTYREGFFTALVFSSFMFVVLQYVIRLWRVYLEWRKPQMEPVMKPGPSRFDRAMAQLRLVLKIAAVAAAVAIAISIGLIPLDDPAVDALPVSGGPAIRP